MPEITAAEFKKVFTATTRATDDQVHWALRGGLKSLRKYVGAEAVQDYQSEAPTEKERADDLEMAHAHLAYCVLALNAGSRVREAGVIKSETQIEDDAKNEYLPPKDIENFVQQHTAKALEFIESYLIGETVIEDGGAIEFSHPSQLGCEFC